MQYWDDVDDLVGIAGLLAEKFRSTVFAVLRTAFLLAAQVAVVLLALAEPPLALATALLLFVRLLYRSVTGPAHP